MAYRCRETLVMGVMETRLETSIATEEMVCV